MVCINKIVNLFKSNELKAGYIYFYIHFILEVTCFFYLSRITNNSNFIWLIPFIYDSMAFVPQSMVGYVSDKYPNINIGLIGTILLIIGITIYSLLDISVFISLFIMCIGNAIVHVSGAEDTLRSSNGKLSPAAIFVSGGSFGVITGRLLSSSTVSPLFLLLPLISTIPLIYLSKSYVKNGNTDNFNYVRKNINIKLIILIAFLVVIARGYIGYGIPISWNKTIIQTVLLFFIMGLGKALGGILSDLIGVRKIAIFSTLLAIPFLCFGDNIMIVSLIGLMLFSMTMPITLGILVSCLKKNPGLAFGITTIGLFLGTAPIFFIKFNMNINIILIIIISILCSISLGFVLKRGDNK